MIKKNKEIKKGSKIINFLKFLIILFAISYLGVIIGYSIVGNGSIIDALDFTAIKHIIDIIFN